ncbi:MAG: hypothetical protein Q9190_004046 [Brigantiaea leucoxantha]
MSSRQKRSKPAGASIEENGRVRPRRRRSGEEKEEEEGEEEDVEVEGYFDGRNGGPGETGYAGALDEKGKSPKGDLVTYPPDQTRGSTLAPSRYAAPDRRDSHFATTLPNRTYGQEETSESSDDDSEDPEQVDESRYSKDYQFTIASPDEEMHGKAVALFDFERENENELPLTEGQVVWVSYRHGQGWLVAEDPRTRDKGLVPEEYVRLLRDIEGGWTSLSEDALDEQGVLPPASGEVQQSTSPPASQTEPALGHSATPHVSNGSGNGHEKRPPIVSTFSTSSRDLDPYPHRLREKQTGQSPPAVVHYGSQANTPTMTSPAATRNLPNRGLSDPEVPSRRPAKEKEIETKSEDAEETSGSSDEETEFHDSKEE